MPSPIPERPRDPNVMGRDAAVMAREALENIPWVLWRHPSWRVVEKQEQDDKAGKTHWDLEVFTYQDEFDFRVQVKKLSKNDWLIDSTTVSDWRRLQRYTILMWCDIEDCDPRNLSSWDIRWSSLFHLVHRNSRFRTTSPGKISFESCSRRLDFSNKDSLWDFVIHVLPMSRLWREQLVVPISEPAFLPNSLTGYTENPFPIDLRPLIRAFRTRLPSQEQGSLRSDQLQKLLNTFQIHLRTSKTRNHFVNELVSLVLQGNPGIQLATTATSLLRTWCEWTYTAARKVAPPSIDAIMLLCHFAYYSELFTLGKIQWTNREFNAVAHLIPLIPERAVIANIAKIFEVDSSVNRILLAAHLFRHTPDSDGGMTPHLWKLSLGLKRRLVTDQREWALLHSQILVALACHNHDDAIRILNTQYARNRDLMKLVTRSNPEYYGYDHTFARQSYEMIIECSPHFEPIRPYFKAALDSFENLWQERHLPVHKDAR